MADDNIFRILRILRKKKQVIIKLKKTKNMVFLSIKDKTILRTISVKITQNSLNMTKHKREVPHFMMLPKKESPVEKPALPKFFQKPNNFFSKCQNKIPKYFKDEFQFLFFYKIFLTFHIMNTIIL